VTRAFEVSTRDWALVASCAIAGGLSVPWNPPVTGIATVVGAMLALLGLWLRWWGVPAEWGSTPAGSSRVRTAIVWYAAGLVVGLVLLGTIRFLIQPTVPEAGARIAAAGQLPVWRRLLIIYVAAVGEELVFRVVLLSVVAGVLVRIVRARRAAGEAVEWLAIGVAAVAFGAVHLPAWSGIGLTAGVVATVMTLNMIGGIVFGHAFVRHGILAAICAHAGADCAIQLIGPLTG
jgi:hypothetical protein